MRIVGHIVRKDFHRLRWILLLWVLLIVAANGMAAIQAQLNAETYYPFHLAAGVFGLALAPLVGFGLVMGFIHDDPVAERNAFWITRPISPGQLLAAKVISLLIVCIIPVIFTCPWWIWVGFGAGDLARAAGQTAGFQAFLTVVALPLAVISPNASRFVLNVILAAAALLVLLLGIYANIVHRSLSFESAVERARLIALVGLGASLAIVLQQFFRRRTGHSIAIMAVAVPCLWIADQWGTGPGGGESLVGEPESALAVPLEAGNRGVGQGRSLSILESMETWRGPLEVTLSTTEPARWTDFAVLVAGRVPRISKAVTYHLMSQKERLVLPGTIRVWGELEVGAINRSHVTLTFHPLGDFTKRAVDAQIVQVVQQPDSAP